tara:strand:- start:2871 stop:3542 length:672 start_codon:yes stop_codon:yes gene_type:complete
MINHEIKCIFIHIPRTGGSSISTAINQRKKKGERFDSIRNVKEKNKIHYTISQAKKTFGEDIYNEYLTFSFVRNPWDRLVSQYKWRIAKNENDVKNKTFKEWVVWRHKNWLNWLVNPRKIIRGVPQIGHRERAIMLTKSFDEIYDNINNKVLVDFVGRYENIVTDIKKLCKKLNINEEIVLPHKHNTKNSKHYTEYYDEDTINIVKEFYANDINILGYKYGEN